MTIDELLKHIKQTNKKVVVFDFDNTICDLVIDWSIWDKEVGKLVQKYDPSIPPSTRYMQDNKINGLLERLGDSFRTEWRRLSAQFEKNEVKGYHPIDKTITLIKKLDVELWIWSSNSKETIRKYLQKLEIENKFSQFITRDNVNFVKPNPDGFLKAANGRDRKEFLMIGNSRNDREASANVGVEYVDVKEIEG